MVWAGGGMPVERTTRALRETLLSEWARTAVSGLPPLLFVLGLGGIYGRDDPYDDEAVKRARSAPGLDANSRFGGAQCAFFGQCCYGRSRNVLLRHVRLSGGGAPGASPVCPCRMPRSGTW